NEARLVALVMVLAGTLRVFMSSSAIVAIFIPVGLAIPNKMGLNFKPMLMPLSGDPPDPFHCEGPASPHQNIRDLDHPATRAGEHNHLPGVDDRIVAGRHQKHARFVLSGLLVANHGAEHVPGRGIDPARKRPTTAQTVTALDAPGATTREDQGGTNQAVRRKGSLDERNHTPSVLAGRCSCSPPGAVY